MTGPLALRRLVESVTGRPGYSRAVGTRILDVQRGQVSMALDRRPDLEQAQGYFHGGVIAGLADHAAGAAVTTALPPGKFAMTVNLQITFLSPAEGDTLVARASALRVGGTIGVAHVDVAVIVDGTEKVCAVATATMRSVALPSAGASS